MAMATAQGKNRQKLCPSLDDGCTAKKQSLLKHFAVMLDSSWGLSQAPTCMLVCGRG